jgi:hypothetical protein
VVERRDPAGDDDPVDLTSLFRLQPDSSIAAAGKPFFQALGQTHGPHVLLVQVLDTQGQVHLQELPFSIAQFTVHGRLSAPPSMPDLDLGGIQVAVSMVNTDIQFLTETRADGTFPLPVLPAGDLLLKASTRRSGVLYRAVGQAVVAGPMRLDVKLRGPVGNANRVPPITTSPL